MASVRMLCRLVKLRTLDNGAGILFEAKTARDVLKRFKRIPEIEQRCSVSGEFDYIAWLRAGSAEQLDKLLDEIGGIDGVIKTTTSIALSRKIDR